MQTLGAAQFESVGAAQGVDILSSLTANTGSYLATQQNYLQGVAQFSLRGVGLSSTLTLVNGRRGRVRAGLQRRGTEFLRHQHAARSHDRARRDSPRRGFLDLRVTGRGRGRQHRHPQGLHGARARRRLPGRDEPGLRPRLRIGVRDGERPHRPIRRVVRTGRELPHRVRLDDPPRHRPGRRRGHRGRFVRLGTRLAG